MDTQQSANANSNPKPRLNWLLLFTTSTTLLCCALPITLVSLGMGATVAALAANAPWLIALSQYKTWVFVISGALIVLAAWALFRPGRACPTDPVLAAACERADKWNRRILIVCAALWCLGAAAAYALPLFIQ